MSQANVTSSPVASTSDRQFGHETVSPADDDSELLAVSSSSSGGGRPGNMTMVVSSQSEQKMLKSIFAGAVFESGSAPVFNFNGSFNLFWVNILRNVYFSKDVWHFSTLPRMNDNSDNLLGHYNFSRFEMYVFHEVCWHPSVLFVSVNYIFAGAFVFRICAFVVDEMECGILLLKWDAIRTFDALR